MLKIKINRKSQKLDTLIPPNEIKQENVDETQSLQSNSLNEQAEEKIYTVENVLRKRFSGKQAYYLIKWKGYSSKQNTWEPSENVEQLDLVKFFEEQRIKSQNERSSNKKSLKRSYYDAIGEIWEVEQVVRKRMKKGEIEYFLKWKDADDCYNTWEPRKKVSHSKAVKAFEKQEKASLKLKEKNRMFHKMGVQECSDVNSAIEYHKAKIALPTLIEDSLTRQYYDCVTFRPINDNIANTQDSWRKHLWEKKMIERNFSKIQREFSIMWNEFMMKNRFKFRGNCHMKPALEKFVEDNKEKLRENHMRAPYIAHVCVLKDHGILDEHEAMAYIMLLR